MRLLMSIMLCVFIGCANREPSQPATPEHKPGQVVTLDAGAEIVAVLVSKDAFDEFKKTQEAKDDAGYKEMLLSGKIVIAKRGTKAKILDHDWYASRYEVRLLDGDTKDAKGWVGENWVKP